MLYNQANIIIRARGDLDGAMAYLKEQERIYSELGNYGELAISLVNPAVTLALQDQCMEVSRAAIDEALVFPMKGGYTALAEQILMIKAKYGF